MLVPPGASMSDFHPIHRRATNLCDPRFGLATARRNSGSQGESHAVGFYGVESTIVDLRRRGRDCGLRERTRASPGVMGGPVTLGAGLF